MDTSFFLQYYTGLDHISGSTAFEQWRDSLPQKIASAFQPERHGDLPKWRNILRHLPVVSGGIHDFSGSVVRLATDAAPSQTVQEELRHWLMQLRPWRKGPYSTHGVDIDSEWRSDLKWNRMQGRITPLDGRLVLDVGCGNGYHCWRMSAAGAAAVIGIDPTLLYLMQYFAVQHFARSDTVFVLPMSLEMLPPDLGAFDTVFSMGVLYHQRSPLDHLLALRACLKPGGELVLETLVLEGRVGGVLVPRERYAQMKNVWFVPDCALLESWLLRCGFDSIQLVDSGKTTSEEQRATSWSTGVSLVDFLDPVDPTKTIEGYPAPVRAILLARKPA